MRQLDMDCIALNHAITRRGILVNDGSRRCLRTPRSRWLGKVNILQTADVQTHCRGSCRSARKSQARKRRHDKRRSLFGPAKQ